VDEPLYLYYQNDNSVLHQKKWNDHCFDIYPALEGLYKHFKLAHAEKKYHDEPPTHQTRLLWHRKIVVLSVKARGRIVL
jgi:hypothetical protein